MESLGFPNSNARDFDSGAGGANLPLRQQCARPILADPIQFRHVCLMPIPDYQSLMLPVLTASSGGEVAIRNVIENLANKLQLSDAERNQPLPSGRMPLFHNRVHWAKFYLTKAGLVEATRRGHFRITQRGQEVLAGKPERISAAFLDQFDEFRHFRERSSTGATEAAIPVEAPPETTGTPDDVMRGAHKQIEAALALDLLDRIRKAPPEFFERIIVDLLLEMGFGGTAEDAGRAIGRSGDDGIDGIIDQDSLGLDRVYIQAKRYAAGNNVGSGAIRDFFGSLDRHRATKGIFVTTSGFSAAARETVEFLSKRIVLIDGDQLAMLLIRHNVGCRIEDTLHIKRIDEDFFD